MKPVTIFIDGQELTQYTGMKLSREKKNLTGSFNAEVFFNYMPSKPVLVNALRSKPVTVYIGGHLAFFGALDRRAGKSETKENALTDVTSSIEPNAYSVSLSARGRTKYLIDSSHQHKTGTILQPTTRQAVEALTKDFKVELDWQAEDVKLERVCFRDGCNVLYELQRLGNENGHYFYETRDGKLRFQDAPAEFGDDLILGKNILSFSADQSEDHDRSRIVVKGQRTKRTVWGEEAALNVLKSAKKQNSGEQDVPYIVQHYGDATPEALDRRVQFEADKRNAQSLQCTVEVFHVMTPSGEPWDIGTLHYVEVPPEGVFNVLECIAVDYTVDAQGTLKTTLTLAPPPSKKDAAPSEKSSIGKQRKAQLGVTSPDIWDPSDLDFSPSFAEPPVVQQPDFLGGIQINQPPLKLPQT